MGTLRHVKLDPELLFDVDRCLCLTFEAELKVTQVETNGEEDSKNCFVKDMQSMLYDSKNSDVVVIAENQTPLM